MHTVSHINVSHSNSCGWNVSEDKASISVCCPSICSVASWNFSRLLRIEDVQKKVGRDKGQPHGMKRSPVASARITKSPKKDKKFRAIVTRKDGSIRRVDFGAKGMSDFTKHKDPHRMASYVRRHGAGTRVNLEAMRRRSPEQVHKTMSKIRVSDREKWDDPETPGYWSRWLLWSEPTLEKAARGIERRDGFRVSL